MCERAGLSLLGLGVLALHLLLAESVIEQRLGWGAGERPPARIEVAFVRELVAAAPPVLAPPAPPVARLAALAAARPRAAASAPAAADNTAMSQAAVDPPTDIPPVQDAASPQPLQALPEPAPTVPAPDPAPPMPVPVAPVPVAAVPAPAASTAAPTPFAWPPSTRLNFKLSGFYRGPVDGTAQVEWLVSGQRYQVRMGTSIGPVLSRNIVSEGELTDAGLRPQRFDGEQKVLFRAARRWSLRFGAEHIVLPDGNQIDNQPGAQDEASQFVQLTWLFTTRPELLQVGRSVDLPLIVNRTLERWTYDVVAEELLQLPFGAVPSLHVKPRRAARPGDLSAEIWFAPSLQTLPVRILIRQSAESWVDLTLEKPPLQAAEPAAGLR